MKMNGEAVETVVVGEPKKLCPTWYGLWLGIGPE